MRVPEITDYGFTKILLTRGRIIAVMDRVMGAQLVFFITRLGFAHNWHGNIESQRT